MITTNAANQLHISEKKQQNRLFKFTVNIYCVYFINVPTRTLSCRRVFVLISMLFTMSLNPLKAVSTAFVIAAFNSIEAFTIAWPTASSSRDKNDEVEDFGLYSDLQYLNELTVY